MFSRSVMAMIVVTTVRCGAADQRWLAAGERLAADGALTEFALPHPMSSPTTIASRPTARCGSRKATAIASAA